MCLVRSRNWKPASGFTPPNPEAHFALGLLRWNQEDLDGAIHEVRVALSQRLITIWRWALEKNGVAKTARAAFAKTAELDPRHKTLQ